MDHSLFYDFCVIITKAATIFKLLFVLIIMPAFINFVREMESVKLNVLIKTIKEFIIIMVATINLAIIIVIIIIIALPFITMPSLLIIIFKVDIFT